MDAVEQVVRRARERPLMAAAVLVGLAAASPALLLLALLMSPILLPASGLALVRFDVGVVCALSVWGRGGA